VRLFGASRISADLLEAQRLLACLHMKWPEALISLIDIYQGGPTSIRDKVSAHRAVTILVDHGWLVGVPPSVVNGKYRREVWRIVRS
jgi:hypothetical protein